MIEVAAGQRKKMRSLGWITVMAGGALAFYALMVFDPTVSTPMGRIYNIGALQLRQNLLIVASVLCITGVLMVIMAKPSAARRTHEFAPAFEAAMESGNLVRMEEMISSGKISANGRDRNGIVWLLRAAQSEGIDQCRVLLRYGADPSLSSKAIPSPREYISKEIALGPTAALEEMRSLFDNPSLPTPTPAQEMASEPLLMTGDLVGHLQSLAAMHESGALSKEQYEAAKGKLLSSTG